MMYRIAIIAAVLMLLAPVAVSQVWLDGFAYPTGTAMGNWQEDVGNWGTDNGRARAAPQFLWQYATQQKLAFRDCVAQCLVMHNGGVKHTLQFGGVALRCVAPGSGTSLIMVKVQNNNYTVNTNKFDAVFLNSPGLGGSISTANLTPFASAKVRLTVLDARIIAQIDANLDGIWDHTLTTTATTIPPAAPIGICGFGGVHIDNYELFDAVLLHDTATQKPLPGNEVKLVMRGAPSLGYFAVSALGNAGFPISTTARFPLSPDNLFGLTAQNLLPSVFKNFRGVLDSKGDGKLSIQIPNIAALKGVTIFTAYVVYGSTQIVNISNDYQFTIQ